MRVKISVRLTGILLEEIDRANLSRSAFLEQAARWYLNRATRSAQDGKDAAIFERCAVRSNREATDVLEYQEFPI